MNDLRMIQALHFPELAKEVNAVQQAYIPMLKFIGADMGTEPGFFARAKNHAARWFQTLSLIPRPIAA